MSENTNGQSKQGKNAPNFVGKGNVTLSTISSKALLLKRLAKTTPANIVAFIASVIAPVGHPDYLNMAQAAQTHCPEINALTAKCQAFNALTEFMTDLVHGQEAEVLAAKAQQDAIDAEAARVAAIKRPRLTVEQKAAIEAEDRLRTGFRTKHGLNARGRVPLDKAEAMETHVTDNLESETRKVMREWAKAEKEAAAAPVQGHVQGKVQGQLVATA